MLQIIIINNHMNGKDTHVRGLKVLGPAEYVPVLVLIQTPRSHLCRTKVKDHEEPFPFVAPQYRMYGLIR